METNFNNSATMSSSDTYHTAESSCCSTQLNIVDGPENLIMSDSGVELRPSSRPHEDESDFSSTEDDFNNKVSAQ